MFHAKLVAISLHFILLLGLTILAFPQITSIFAFMAKWVYLSLRDPDVVFYAIWPAGHISRAVCWASLAALRPVTLAEVDVGAFLPRLVL